MTVEASTRNRAPVRRTVAAAAAAPGAGRRARRTSDAARRLAASSRRTRDSPHLVQDAYSLRCAPQVHGAARDVLTYARGRAASGGERRHRQPDRAAPTTTRSARAATSTGSRWRVALDSLALATVGLANISERRLYRLLDPASNGLPPFLIEGSGLHSGFMLVQYTAASLVSRVQVARAPGVRRVDPVVGGAGGSREHGDDRGSPRAGHGDERRDWSWRWR